MLAILNLEGTVPELRETLNSLAKEGAKVSAHRFRTTAGRPSWPVALRSSSDLHRAATSNGSTGWKDVSWTGQTIWSTVSGGQSFLGLAGSLTTDANVSDSVSRETWGFWADFRLPVTVLTLLALRTPLSVLYMCIVLPKDAYIRPMNFTCLALNLARFSAINLARDVDFVCMISYEGMWAHAHERFW